jgi:PPOX class probable FMN-dependent enzyme
MTQALESAPVSDGRIETVEQLREIIGAPHAGLGDKNIDHLDEFARAFLERCPFLVLSTADAQGHQDASPKGDAPGFVLVEDDRHLVIPDRPGNKLAYGLENILENPRVGILFLIPGTAETFRVNGHAELVCEPELMQRLAARGRPAVVGIRVTIEEAFFHCAKAFIRSKLWKHEQWGERHKVSFGEMFAKIAGAGKDAARAVDAAVEQDYETNL